MELTSPVFTHEGMIPKRYTCDGLDISPPLVISDVPEEAESLVLIMDDPDAPSGTWDHWVVFNISPSVREIEEELGPEGVFGVGTSGETMYQGPCPPDREHRYFFRVYALDTLIDLPEGSKKHEVERAMSEHILDEAELMGVYDRAR